VKRHSPQNHNFLHLYPRYKIRGELQWMSESETPFAQRGHSSGCRTHLWMRLPCGARVEFSDAELLSVGQILSLSFLNGGFLMFSQSEFRNMIAAAAIVLASALAVHAADPFTLTSTTFKDGQMMPRKVANNLSTNPNCVGQNVSPQLA